MISHLIFNFIIITFFITFRCEFSHADIFSFIDNDGVIHFTNISPQGKNKKKWKRIMRTGPGKASEFRGQSFDRTAPKDRSKQRFQRFNAHIYEASQYYQIPIALIRAVIHAESDFDPNVISYAGAQGLMQLLPSVSKEMGLNDPFDPRQNIFGGVRYLRVLANRFKGDLINTLAGYHAGPGAVEKYNGIPPYQTTQEYIQNVVSRYRKIKSFNQLINQQYATNN